MSLWRRADGKPVSGIAYHERQADGPPWALSSGPNRAEEGVIMPNPKHKHSRARRDKRRTQKLRMTPPGMAVCPQCHELKLPHYTCLNCGTYKGKAVIQVEEA